MNRLQAEENKISMCVRLEIFLAVGRECKYHTGEERSQIEEGWFALILMHSALPACKSQHANSHRAPSLKIKDGRQIERAKRGGVCFGLFASPLVF